MREMLNTAMFGGNTGRQGVFDPNDSNQQSMALERLKQLYADYGDKLGFDYTGETGLAKNDLTGYAQMQNAKTEAQNIQNVIGGQDPMRIKFGGMLKGLQQAGPKPMPEGHQQFMSRYGRG